VTPSEQRRHDGDTAGICVTLALVGAIWLAAGVLFVHMTRDILQ
jgi:hypothetical protein